MMGLMASAHPTFLSSRALIETVATERELSVAARVEGVDVGLGSVRAGRCRLSLQDSDTGSFLRIPGVAAFDTDK